MVMRPKPLIQTAEKRAHRRSSSMPNFPASIVQPLPQKAASPPLPTKKDFSQKEPMSPVTSGHGFGPRKDRYGSLRSLTGRPRRPMLWGDDKRDEIEQDPQDHFRSRSLTVQSSSLMKKGKRTDARCLSTESLRPRKQSFTEGSVEFSRSPCRFSFFFLSFFFPPSFSIVIVFGNILWTFPLIDANRSELNGTGQINNYMIVKELGKGSFGTVKDAVNTIDGKHYAIKVISKQR